MSYLQKPSYYTISLVVVLLLPFTIICASFLLPFSAYLRNPVVAAAVVASSGCRREAAAEAVPPVVAEEDVGGGGGRPERISVLVGVHTMAKKHSRRHLVRMAYALQQTPALRAAARVDVRFALCARPMPPEHRAFVALEARAYGDVLLFDCEERPDQGKTYDYFAGLPAMLGPRDPAGGRPPYDYVMKVDDDMYLRLDALVETLRRSPREDMYYGAGLPFLDKRSPPFMLGMGYVLSWDLVEWIAGSDMVKALAIGAEDVTTGTWLNMGNKAKNRVNIFPRMYDFKGANPEDFLEGTIGVHQLKQDLRWAQALEHFNVTWLDPSRKTTNLIFS
ncbi:beta-1,3-galactosyltransferase 6-like [Oryza brachyantha]|uniref:beta-1,3-galactosyltransferase 6-like n=1 Tax=Oryza brachyantha TaxID=4533 RepID=UPI001ADB1851|nr:beta-1,3-galactosyltransferase 6-like [Oryza brachyantha]